jgi:hypothetical protein
MIGIHRATLPVAKFRVLVPLNLLGFVLSPAATEHLTTQNSEQDKRDGGDDDAVGEIQAGVSCEVEAYARVDEA